MGYRIESDSMGNVKVPEDALYGAQTQRAIENFPISGRRFPSIFISMLGELKLACALANRTFGRLESKIAEAIMHTAQKVSDGEYNDHFPIDIFQTGSGTSTNMNANEVIANLANQKLGSPLGSKNPIHPNDHVNAGQSSNDVIPTTIHLAAAQEIKNGLILALAQLERELAKKAKAFSDIVKIGRTHLMDATPMFLGQEFSGYAHQVTEAKERLERVLPSLYELPIGGTAIGTGINTHPHFGREVAAILAKRLALPFKETRNHFAAQGAKDACVEASSAVKGTAVALMKIADDIRWLGNGPRAGFAELKLPDLQPGSSIMPGKVNPVIPEVVCQVAIQVIANDVAVTGGAASGRFELNAMMPLIAINLLDSIHLLTNAAKVFTEKCIAGLEANRERCEELVERSLMLVTPLAKHIGYDKAAAIAKRAYAENKTIREVALEEKILDEQELDTVLDIRKMTESR